MAVNKKTIQRRIKSVKNTRKITKAMELVAAAKMKKATDAVSGSRPYVKHLRELVREISDRTDISKHPLLRKREGTGRVILVLIMSDRGLAGGYNVQMQRAARAFKDARPDATIDVITMGKRAAHAAKMLGLNIIETYTDVTSSPSAETVRPIVKTIVDGFTTSVYDEAFIGYTDFRSVVSQLPTIMSILPFGERDRDLGDVSERVMDTHDVPEPVEQTESPEFTFEPGELAILDQVLPRIMESEVYQALLEAAASEHSARMMAMKSASDAASDMIDDLTLTYNQARQAAITQEIAEISSGKAALE
ncbi:ATP synthase F1 subunit gamma [Candidatus Uhrbacteria bacterium]|nr:ATP synthase F1 subunit gamma [Candidatus Uhrbacteria bacterium]